MKPGGIVSFYWRVVLRPYFWQSLAIFSLVFFCALMDSLTVALSIPLLETVSKQDIRLAGVTAHVEEALRWMGFSFNKNQFIFILLSIMVALFTVRSFSYLISQFYIGRIGFNVRRKVKTQLVERFLNFRYAAFVSRSRGAIVRDIEATSEDLYTNISRIGFFFSSLVNLVMLLILMVYLSWQATCVLAFIAVAGIQGWRWFSGSRTKVYGSNIYELRRMMSQLIVDAIDGIRVVKSFDINGVLVKKFDGLISRETGYLVRNVFFANGSGPMMETVAGLVILCLGAVVFLAPGQGVGFPLFGAFLLALRRMGPLISNLNLALVEINLSRKGLEVMEEILYRAPLEEARPLSVSRVDCIHLKDVGFFYGDKETLRDFNLSFNKGTVTAIVGPTGAGKSTLVNLLMGFHEPSQGDIFVDGVRFKDIDRQAWRRKIGYVSQDVFLFNATLKENITLWSEAFTQADVERAARFAQIHEFAQTLSLGYDTVVGDRGVRFSGGQCQRVALARAILRNPEVLIFDEATSALDNLTEKAVYEALDLCRAKSIIILISHRLNTIHEADHIFVIQDGRIIEHGSHEDLIRENGYYHKLHNVEVVS